MNKVVFTYIWAVLLLLACGNANRNVTDSSVWEMQPVTGKCDTVSIDTMERGTFSFRFNVKAKISDGLGDDTVNIPIDVVIKSKKLSQSDTPIFIECKSAGDFANTNKRRKEEATKMRQLKATYGKECRLYLFLCGYFDTGYLGYEAAEGLDWIWEHRISDMELLEI